MNIEQLKNIIEAAMLVSSKPMTLAHMEALFEHDENTPEPPAREQLREAISLLQQDYESRGIELVEVASGWRMQSRQEMSPWIANLFQEKAPRYSRALLETLVLVAYRQPITRSEIEDVRGVAVSANIVKTLIERDWVKVVGHRDVPGRPELLGTTKQFLDYFNLRKIGDLPTLSEIKSLDEIAPDLAREVAMLDPADADPESAEQTDDAGSADEEAGKENKAVQSSEVEADDAEADATDASSAVAAELAGSVDESADPDLDQGDSVVSSNEAVTTDASDESADDDEALSVVDVELPLEQDAGADSNGTVADIDENAAESTKASGATTATDNDKEDNPDDSLNVAEATLDALSNVPRPETELLH